LILTPDGLSLTPNDDNRDRRVDRFEPKKPSRPFAVRTCLVLAAAAYSYPALATVLVFLVAMFENLIPLTMAYWLSKARDFVIAPLGGLEKRLREHHLGRVVADPQLLHGPPVSPARSSRAAPEPLLGGSSNRYVLVASTLVLAGMLCVSGCSC